jgi:hypothetical protein
MPRRWQQGSAQGFNPRGSTLGTLEINEFALMKGREADPIKLVSIAELKLECASDRCYNGASPAALLVGSLYPYRPGIGGCEAISKMLPVGNPTQAGSLC